jgi:hypothetical protein
MAAGLRENEMHESQHLAEITRGSRCCYTGLGSHQRVLTALYSIQQRAQHEGEASACRRARRRVRRSGQRWPLTKKPRAPAVSSPRLSLYTGLSGTFLCVEIPRRASDHSRNCRIGQQAENDDQPRRPYPSESAALPGPPGLSLAMVHQQPGRYEGDLIAVRRVFGCLIHPGRRNQKLCFGRGTPTPRYLGAPDICILRFAGRTPSDGPWQSPKPHR